MIITFYYYLYIVTNKTDFGSFARKLLSALFGTIEQ